VVRGRERNTPKTPYRIRKIPITYAIRERLNQLLSRNSEDLVVTTKRRTILRPANFRKDVWQKAQKGSGITDKVPYSLRHSFAAGSLAIGVHPNRLVRLMGHGSKQMVYEVYGEYIDGLEQDAEKILDYFGPDFLSPKTKNPALQPTFGERFGESRG
jgi:integrase